MKSAHSLRGAIKPGVAIATLMIILTSIFVSIAFYVDYQKYFQIYHISQAKEIKEIKHKEEALFKELKIYLTLAQKRIEAAEGNLERLQKVISSLTHLTINQIPINFRKVSYHKLSIPAYLVTRFGARQLNTESSPKKLTISQNGALWKAGCLIGLLHVISKHKVDGILEAQIDAADLNSYFGILSTVSITFSEGAIKVDKKAIQSFWGFANESKHRYVIFGFLAFVLLLTLTGGVFTANRIAQNKYAQQVQQLGDALSISKQQAYELKSQLAESEENTHSLQASRQAHFKLQAAIGGRQKERAKWLTQSLDVIKQHYQNPNVYMSDQDQFDIIRQCQNEALSLSLGVWKSIENENVDLKKTISSTLQLFAEKTYKSSISIDMKLPIGPCDIPGDDLLMELLFMNIVGKAIHRVPKNGRISISLTETKNDFCLEVIDNGYTDTSSAEKLIKKSFDLFLSDGNFLHICQENGLNYKHKKETNGLNASCLILPFKEEEVPKNNVVKLFKT